MIATDKTPVRGARRSQRLGCIIPPFEARRAPFTRTHDSCSGLDSSVAFGAQHPSPAQAALLDGVAAHKKRRGRDSNSRYANRTHDGFEYAATAKTRLSFLRFSS